MHEGHGTSGFHTPAACCLRGFPSESMPFTSLLQNIYSKPHSAAQSRSADYNCRQRLLPAVYQTSSPAAASHAAMEPASQCSEKPAHKPFIRKMRPLSTITSPTQRQSGMILPLPLLRHVFPRKKLDVRPSEEKRKARYDEQDSQKDIDILHNRSHLSVIRFIRPFPGAVSQPAQAGKPAQQDRDRGKPDQGSDLIRLSFCILFLTYSTSQPALTTSGSFSAWRTIPSRTWFCAFPTEQYSAMTSTLSPTTSPLSR